MRRPLLLDLFCGAGGAAAGYHAAGFGLRRERWFETSWSGFALRSPCSHSDETVTVTGHPGGSSKRDGTSGFGSTADWKRAMGIDWMTGKELAQAIPPAYTEYIGHHLMARVAHNNYQGTLA